MALTAADFIKQATKAPSKVIEGSGSIARNAYDMVKKGLVADFDIPNATPKQMSMIKGTSRFLTASTLFIGGTSLIDAARTSQQNKEARAKQEQQLKKQEEEERKKAQQRRKQSRGNNFVIQQPNPVFEMHNNRSGHHKMGNNKFY